MPDISKIDENFEIAFPASDGEYMSIDEEPFRIYGVSKDEFGYYRVPPKVMENLSDGLKYLNRNTAGGTIRFSTDSPTLAIKAENPVNATVLSHMALLGADGFEVFEGKHFLGTFMPTLPINVLNQERTLFTEKSETDKDGFRELTVYMPLYGSYKDIGIKLANGSRIRRAKNYRIKKPAVFYGSSITQGGCASSPAKAYTNILSMEFDMPCTNLGFSGGAKGEHEIAEYISGLDMSVFVLDYDHNASVELLAQSHESFFKTVREKNPLLPIIMASSIPGYWMGGVKGSRVRRDIIYKTYENAVKSGDKNVYFLDGWDFFKDVPYDYCTVDGTHPNDMGMYYMAKNFGKVLSQLKL